MLTIVSFFFFFFPFLWRIDTSSAFFFSRCHTLLKIIDDRQGEDKMRKYNYRREEVLLFYLCFFFFSICCCCCCSYNIFAVVVPFQVPHLNRCAVVFSVMGIFFFDNRPTGLQLLLWLTSSSPLSVDVVLANSQQNNNFIIFTIVG